MKVYVKYTAPADEDASHTAFCKAWDMGWDLSRDDTATRAVRDDDHADDVVAEFRELGFNVNDYKTE